MQQLASPCAAPAPALRLRRALQRRRAGRVILNNAPAAAAVHAAASAAAPGDTGVAASFRALLQRGAAQGGSESALAAAAAAPSLEVGPCRRALKALSAAHPTLLNAAPTSLLAALGCAGAALCAEAEADVARSAVPLLPWRGSPEPGDGLAASSRRLTDALVHGERSGPPPRVLDVGIVLLALALVPEADTALPADVAAVAVTALAVLRGALGDAQAAASAPGLVRDADAGGALTRLLATAPPRSAAAERAAEQARFAALGAAKAERAAANAEAAATRRLARGDWRCDGCGTLNFPDRRVCYACLQPPAEAEEWGGRPDAAPRPVQRGGATSQQKPPRSPDAQRNAAAAAERRRRGAAPEQPRGAGRNDY